MHPLTLKTQVGWPFEAVAFAQKENFDILILDTAGRLHTQTNLMEELKKIKRSLEKASKRLFTESAPVIETFLVLDAHQGQNALSQAQLFHESLGLTGVFFTKVDGTSKRGSGSSCDSRAGRACSRLWCGGKTGRSYAI